MNVFKVLFETQGGHVHCSLFCAPRPDHTYAKCGDFVVRRGPEFVDLMWAFKNAAFQAREGASLLEASTE